MPWETSLPERTVQSMGLLSFMHAPYVPPKRRELRRAKADFAILGVPIEGGPTSGIPGTSLGPRAIRTGSEALISYNAEYDVEISDYLNLVDCGDVAPVVNQVERSHELIQSTISEILAAGVTPIILGGDHSIPIPVGRALNERVKGKIGMIQFDSHLDTYEEPSWFKVGNWNPISKCAELKHFKSSSFAQIGIRGDLNPPLTVKIAKELGIRTFYRHEVFDRGIRPVVREAIEIAHEGTDAVYVTFDIDSIDAAHAPATSIPAIGGLSTMEAMYAVMEIAKAGVACFDLVEVGNPAADPNNITGRAAATIILQFLAGAALRRAKRKD